MRFALFLVLLMTVPKFEAPMLKLKKLHPSGVRAAFNRRYVLVSCAGPSFLALDSAIYQINQYPGSG